MNCPACTRDGGEEVIAVEGAPPSCQQLFRTQKESLAARSCDIDFVACTNCGLIWNRSFSYGAESHYGDDYYCSFVSSAQARTYQESLASQLANTLQLNGKTVLEVGCGDGFFLQQLRRFGATVVGFEPSSLYEIAASRLGKAVVRDFFKFGQEPEKAMKVDLLVMRNVLEHLAEPRAALSALSIQRFGGEPLKYLFLEVPNALHLLENNLYFDFYNDHVCYFGRSSLDRLLRSTGWLPKRIDGPEEEFARVLCTNLAYRPQRTTTPQPIEGVEDILAASRRFHRSFTLWKADLLALLQGRIETGQRIAAWGSGSRGVMLLASLRAVNDWLAYAVDSDPNKQGKFIPGSGLPIYPPARLHDDPVGSVIITSYTFYEEIARDLAWFRRQGGSLLKVYPVPSSSA